MTEYIYERTVRVSKPGVRVEDSKLVKYSIQTLEEDQLPFVLKQMEPKGPRDAVVDPVTA